MSLLYDRKINRALHRAWKKRIKERKISMKRNPSLLRKWFNSLMIFGFSLLALKVLLTIPIDAQPSTSSEITAFILTFSSLGSILVTLLHFALVSPRDITPLIVTPCDSPTILKHTLRKYTKTIIFFLALIPCIIIGSMKPISFYEATGEMEVIFIAYGTFITATFLFLTIGYYFNPLTISKACFGILVFITLIPMIFGGSWSLLIQQPLMMFWPPAWPVGIVRKPMEPWQYVIILAIISSAVYHFYRHCKNWKLVRSLYKRQNTYSDETLKKNQIPPHNQPSPSSQITKNDLLNHPQQALLPKVTFAEPQRNKQWIEWLIWKSFTEEQRNIYALTDIPSYTKNAFSSVTFILLGCLVLSYLPKFLHSSFITFFVGTSLVTVGVVSLIPLLSSASFLYKQFSICPQKACPLFSLLPISINNIFQMRWKEGLIRSMFSTPILSSLLFFSLWKNSDFINDGIPLIFFSLFVVIWFQLHWINLSTSSIFFINQSGIKSPQPFWFKWPMFVLTSLYFISFVSICFISYHWLSHTSSTASLIIVGGMAMILAFLLPIINLRHYRSKKTTCLNHLY